MDILEEDLIDWFDDIFLSSHEYPLPPKSPDSPLVPSSSPTSPGSPLVPSNSPVSPKLPVTSKLPPSSLLKPARSSAHSLLVSVSPSAHPQSAQSWHYYLPRDFQSPAPPRHEDPLSPPPASKSWTTPRSFDPSAPP